MYAEPAVRAYGAVDPDATALEIAEALWFACVVRPGGVADSGDRGTPRAWPPIPEPAGEAGEDHSPEEPEPEPDDVMAQTVTVDPRSFLNVLAWDSPAAMPATGHPVQVPDASALPARKAIQRALRPLKRRVPSDRQLLVDEEESTRLIAETRSWMPVLKPAPAKWLELALIVDSAPSMDVWRTVVGDLATTLRQLGAFRDIRRWQLHPGADPGTAAIAPYSASSERSRDFALRRPGELVDAARRRVFLVVTDGAAEMWRDGSGSALLSTLGTNGPVAVLQPLPERLWGRTGLATRRGTFRSTEPGSATGQTRFAERRRQPRPLDPGDVPVPVLEIAPEWLASWCAIVTASSATPVSLAATIASPQRAHDRRLGPAAHAVDDAASADPRQRLSRFRASASPMAHRLAVYLSVVPLQMPVMRLVQHAMLPDSGPTHLSEVLLGGIIRSVDGAVSFEFLPGVRSLLLDGLRISEANQVIDTVSCYVIERGGLPGRTFAGLATLPDGVTERVLDGPFAWIPMEILERMGVTPAQSLGAAVDLTSLLDVALDTSKRLARQYKHFSVRGGTVVPNRYLVHLAHPFAEQVAAQLHDLARVLATRLAEFVQQQGWAVSHDLTVTVDEGEGLQPGELRVIAQMQPVPVPQGTRTARLARDRVNRSASGRRVLSIVPRELLAQYLKLLTDELGSAVTALRDSIEPAKVLNECAREAAVLGVPPIRFSVALSRVDLRRIAALAPALSRVLSTILTEYMTMQGWAVPGPVTVDFVQGNALDNGMFQVFAEAADTSAPTGRAAVRDDDRTSGLLERFETAVARLADGHFMGLYADAISPTKLLNGLWHHVETFRLLTPDGSFQAPTRYEVRLAAYDHSRLRHELGPLARRLAGGLADYLDFKSYAHGGDLEITFELKDALEPGVFEIELPAAEPVRAVRPPDSSDNALSLALSFSDGRIIQLAAGTTVIGRDPQLADIAVDDLRVSRRHLQIFVDDGRITLRDAHSVNGTVVNGKQVKAIDLAVGDTITVGSTDIQLLAWRSS
jgi:type III secretion system (T3SS) inner membrane Yop/YscD-like protein/FHA domain-containing protein